MAGLWDQMNTQAARQYGSGATAGAYNAGRYYDIKTEDLAGRMSALVGAALRPISNLPGQTTTSTMNQTGLTSGTSAQSQAGTSTDSNLATTINNLMSQMTGQQAGAEQKGTQQQQIVDMVNRVLGDKSDERYGSALERIAAQRQGLLSQFQGAEAPIADKMAQYGEGGAYGKGEAAKIRELVQQAMAAGRTDLTRSGMASGSTMQGLKARLASDEMNALRGVEDKRLEMLGGAQSEMSGLRAMSANMQAQMRDPSFAGFVGPTGTATTGTTSATGASTAQTQQAQQQTQQQSSEQLMSSLLTRLFGTSQAGATTGATSGSTSQQVQQPMDIGQILGALM